MPESMTRSRNSVLANLSNFVHHWFVFSDLVVYLTRVPYAFNSASYH